MDELTVTTLLEDVAQGRVSPGEAKERLRALPFRNVGGFATIDTHRELRTGAAEVIFCGGKSDTQIIAILQALLPSRKPVLATRMSQAVADAVAAAGIAGRYDATARVFVADGELPGEAVGHVMICCAGTSDLPVAEEAALTAATLGSRVERLYDVGVAGVHRLLSHTERLQAANAIVVVAGMEGALASVVGGLVAAPVIAVPTSVGYGASFGGLAALLTMLNSCASGVSVVNIDNGFGGGFCAHQINARVARAEAAR